MGCLPNWQCKQGAQEAPGVVLSLSFAGAWSSSCLQAWIRTKASDSSAQHLNPAQTRRDTWHSLCECLCIWINKPSIHHLWNHISQVVVFTYRWSTVFTNITWCCRVRIRPLQGVSSRIQILRRSGWGEGRRAAGYRLQHQKLNLVHSPTHRSHLLFLLGQQRKKNCNDSGQYGLR